jgi:hypothetical protein
MMPTRTQKLHLEKLLDSVNAIEVRTVAAPPNLANTRIIKPVAFLRYNHVYLAFHQNEKAVVHAVDGELYICAELEAWAKEHIGHFEMTGVTGAQFVED